MKLYYSPGACSLGIHVLLEEIGKPYELHRLNFPEGDQQKPEFQAVNRKGKVPTLVRDDGSVLTEFPAIAVVAGLSNPERGLLPAGVEGQARALEALDYLVGTIHGQGFGRLFRPMKFTPREADHEEIKAQGREVFEKGLRLMDEQLAGKEYLLGRILDRRRWAVLCRVLGRSAPCGLATQLCRSLCAHDGATGGTARDGAGRRGWRYGVLLTRANEALTTTCSARILAIVALVLSQRSARSSAEDRVGDQLFQSPRQGGRCRHGAAWLVDRSFGIVTQILGQRDAVRG